MNAPHDSDPALGEEPFQGLLEDAYEQAPCGFLLARADGVILRVNQTLLELTGYARDELTSGRRFQDLLPIAGKLFYENQFAPLLRLQGRVAGVAFDLVRRDGDRLPVLMSSVERVDATGRPALVASALVDATDRRAFEQELLRARREAERLAAVVTASSDAIATIAPDGVIQTWNLGAAHLFGYAAQEMVGRGVGALLDGNGAEDAWRRMLAETRAGQTVHQELTGRGADGHEVDLSVRMTPLRGLLGDVAGIAVVMQDIGERRHLEQRQQELLAIVAHELRTPITGIRAHAQLMRRRAAYREQSIDAILTQADQLASLVDDLLLTSQVAGDRLDLHLEKLNLAEEARRAVEQLGLTVSFDAPVDALLVLADRRRLGQVLRNVLTNALKYAPSGSEIQVRADRSGPDACLAITDHGVGMPPEALPHIFERFYRVAETSATTAGTGLGLYISQQIIAAHGGRIEASSELGRGSTFTVVLAALQQVGDERQKLVESERLG